MVVQHRTAGAILRFHQLKLEVGLSKSSIYLRIARGTFPKPVQLGPRSVGWRVSDVEAFLVDPMNYRAEG
jgi:prophage regulatory protein